MGPYVRYVVQTLAFGIFVYQMVLAFEKFVIFDSIPIVKNIDISDAELPDLVICPEWNFSGNYKKFHKHGYTRPTSFMDGNVKNLTNYISWEGNSSVSYKNLTRYLFETLAIELLRVEGRPSENWRFPRTNGEYVQTKNLGMIVTVFDGLCMQLKINSTNANIATDRFNVEISSINDARIYLVDTSKSIYYKINTDSMFGDRLKLQRSLHNFYLADFEEINLMEESGECTNYGVGADFLSLADCVAHTQAKVFNPLLGCLPPWIVGHDNQDMCTGQV